MRANVILSSESINAFRRIAKIDTFWGRDNSSIHIRRHHPYYHLQSSSCGGVIRNSHTIRWTLYNVHWYQREAHRADGKRAFVCGITRKKLKYHHFDIEKISLYLPKRRIDWRKANTIIGVEMRACELVAITIRRLLLSTFHRTTPLHSFYYSSAPIIPVH